MKPILYAEDDDNDVYLMGRTLEDLGVKQPLRVVTDGKAAIAYLAGTDPFSDVAVNPTPCLVLLDLSMPGRKGLEVLQWIRAQPRLTGLPVIVLTSSNHQTDIHQAYLLGANGYFVKPGDPDELLQILRTVKDCWLGDKPSGPELAGVVRALKSPWLDNFSDRTSFREISAFRAPPDGDKNTRPKNSPQQVSQLSS